MKYIKWQCLSTKQNPVDIGRGCFSSKIVDTN